jgi:hypothetical protein
MTASPPGCLRSDFAWGADCRPPTKNLAPAALHLFVECAYVADHRFAFQGGVVVVGVVNSNQILRHVFSLGMIFPAGF